MNDVLWTWTYVLFTALLLAERFCVDVSKDEMDKVIEDEITHKLSDDLLQSLERKFEVDLQKSVDTVLLKIKLLLKNGTAHIQERMTELQETLDIIKSHGEKEASCKGHVPEAYPNKL